MLAAMLQECPGALYAMREYRSALLIQNVKRQPFVPTKGQVENYLQPGPGATHPFGPRLKPGLH